ncbi:3-ketoacyl-ACP reductase [Rhodophyticola porphyridii]|uniref:3-ketoacyl-ACP reductase n=1 Tax=Rhodophyticola porphyridii TaxID=1852017 RepID=A0A3L9Y048_9RHOB|nr:3-ketoacyl-ACP reductase [Rhodophyticola porphyridii]RMA41842.1 3-ketoacyl-ACP reductase [Rhodophyticola porphyridii]
MTRTALITGGQQGIGLGIARALRGAGYRVAVCSEQGADSSAARRAVKELEVEYFVHDLNSLGNEADLVGEIEARLGPLTCFISNAGVPAHVRGDMLGLTPDSFDHVMSVNLRGAFFLAQEVARRMLAMPSAHYRSLQFVTSVSASMASVERAEYCMSKAAASMMAQLFAARLAEAGIGVFELRPGIIETAMTAGAKDTYDARIAAGLVPAKRWGQPADLGQVVAALAEGQFAFSTGAIIPVDGGLSIERL